MLTAEKPKPYQEVPRTLGEHLRKRRLQLGITQLEVAVKVGVTEYTILNWEHDYKQPAITRWPALIAFLGYDPNPERRTLGDELRAFRRWRGLTQDAVAERLGVGSGTIARWESGSTEPRDENRRSLLGLLAIEQSSAEPRLYQPSARG